MIHACIILKINQWPPKEGGWGTRYRQLMSQGDVALKFRHSTTKEFSLVYQLSTWMYVHAYS